MTYMSHLRGEARFANALCRCEVCAPVFGRKPTIGVGHEFWTCPCCGARLRDKEIILANVVGGGRWCDKCQRYY